MPNKPRIWAVYLSLGILSIARIVLSFIPDGRVWGLNQLAYFSPPVAAAMIAIILIMLLLLFQERVINAIDNIGRLIPAYLARFPQFLLWAAFAVGLFAIFYIFKDKTSLLGDGLLRIGELQNRRIEDFLVLHPAEPLDYLIHYFFYCYVLAIFKLKPIVSYQLLSAISGIVYIFAAYNLADRVGKIIGSKLYAFLYLISWGGMMLFFGYVESYALAASVAMVFFGYALRYVQGSGNDLILVGLFLLSFFFHNVSIVFIPAIIYLLFQKRYPKIGRPIIISSIMLIIIGIWATLAYNSHNSGALLLLSSVSERGYYLFSPAHIIDVINELFLISPGFIALIWIQSYKQEGWLKQYQIFCWLATFGGLAFLFMVDPVLGMARDWDLFGLSLLGLHIGLLVGADWTAVSKRAMTAILVIVISSTSVWIGLNHIEAASVARYQNIAGLDKERSRYAYERLGTYLLLNQKWQEAESVYQLSLTEEPHFRTYLGLAYIQMQQGKTTEAQSNYEKALELKPDQALALFSLCRMYIQQGRLAEARNLFDRLESVSTKGIVNISEKGINDLESALLQAEAKGGGNPDTSGYK
jgi:hypothetical protein